MKIRKCYFMDPDDLVALRALAGSLGISEAGLVRRMVSRCLRRAKKGTVDMAKKMKKKAPSKKRGGCK